MRLKLATSKDQKATKKKAISARARAQNRATRRAPLHIGQIQVLIPNRHYEVLPMDLSNGPSDKTTFETRHREAVLLGQSLLIYNTLRFGPGEGSGTIPINEL